MKKYKIANGNIQFYYPKGFFTNERKSYKKARFKKARKRILIKRWYEARKSERKRMRDIFDQLHNYLYNT